MMCAPEERLDATPTGHRVGVEDAGSDREDCERRAWRPLTRDTLPRPYHSPTSVPPTTRVASSGGPDDEK